MSGLPARGEVPDPASRHWMPESVSVAHLTERLGRLSEQRMRGVCAALAVSVDCR